MPVIPLTRDNLDHLKRAARSATPAVGSSHLSEALAALCGYRTHAALVAFLSMPSTASLLVRPRPNQLLERVRSLGHTASDAAAILESFVWADMPTPAWCEFKNGNLGGVNRWFRSCQRRCAPYIYITTRRKLARVDWDWISVNPSQDDSIRDFNGRHALDRMFAAFREHAAPYKAVFYGSSFVGNVDRLTFESARVIADEIALVLNEMQRSGAAEAA